MKINSFFRKIRYGQPVIVVSGLPRSGTSMLMKMLDAAGLEIASDGQRTADDDNPKGYYELERIKELDKGKDKSWLSELHGRVVKIISLLLMELPDGNNYKVIFVKRNLQEVIASQNKMLVNRGEPLDPEGDEKMIRMFENHLSKVRYMMDTKQGFEVLYLNHREILSDPNMTSQKINMFLGGHLDETKMAGVVDQELYRNRA